MLFRYLGEHVYCAIRSPGFRTESYAKPGPGGQFGATEAIVMAKPGRETERPAIHPNPARVLSRPVTSRNL